jgi:AraC-like DNA-binding protein
MLANPKLDDLERRIAALPTQVGVGCWIRAADGQPSFWSAEVFQSFGFSRQEQPPSMEQMFARIDPPDRQRLVSDAARCVRGREPFEVEYTIARDRKRIARVKSRGQLLPAARTPTFIGTLLDLTALYDLAAELAAWGRSAMAETAPCASANALTPQQWRRVQDLIHSQERGPLTVAEMAAHVRLRPAAFARAFKATTGQTPRQYVLSQRLERAREALRAASQTITGVAVDFGFFDQAHFTRHFKRRYGVTPGMFVQLARG